MLSTQTWYHQRLVGAMSAPNSASKRAVCGQVGHHHQSLHEQLLCALQECLHCDYQQCHAQAYALGQRCTARQQDSCQQTRQWPGQSCLLTTLRHCWHKTFFMIAFQAKRAGLIVRQCSCALMLVRSYQLCCRLYVFCNAAQHSTRRSFAA